MKIAGILFDKDGTLLDFNEFWVPAAQRVIRRIFSDYRISDTKRRVDCFFIGELLAVNGIGI